MNRKNTVLHYVISICTAIISLVLQVTAIVYLRTGLYNEAETAFLLSYALIAVVLLYLYFICHLVNKIRIKAKNHSITFTRMATSLARDYDGIYYINTEDDSYVEYGVTDDDDETLRLVSSGDNFYTDAEKNIKDSVCDEDKQKMLKILSKENIENAMNNNDVLHEYFRIFVDGVERYHNLKVIQGHGVEEKYIVVGIRDVDAQKRREIEMKSAAEEGITFGKIAQALASGYEVLYYVDLETDEFYEYCASEEYSKLDIGSHGTDFFGTSQRNMERGDIYPEDYPMMAAAMERESFINSMQTRGFLSLTYRLMLNDLPEYVNLRAVFPKNDDKHVVIGVININEAMQREREYKQQIDNVMNLANRDALTGVKNKNAYNNLEAELNKQITNESKPEFAIAICDVNNLKQINDTRGHKAGDAYIREACMMVCRVFKHSPVYRVGGDEFVVVMRGDDYDNRNALLTELRTQVEINKEEGGIVLACGLSTYNEHKDISVAEVFERADYEMYKNKKILKSTQD
ncbi:MAG: GGDEF domain-containing protein [Eubacterium sp.]|nr:GGDEF domain-containing protein [Eubacterium sp.]